MRSNIPEGVQVVGGELWLFNDPIERTKAEVLAVYDTTIARLQSQVVTP